jgi:hypothetical protein
VKVKRYPNGKIHVGQYPIDSIIYFGSADAGRSTSPVKNARGGVQHRTVVPHSRAPSRNAVMLWIVQTEGD